MLGEHEHRHGRVRAPDLHSREQPGVGVARGHANVHDRDIRDVRAHLEPQGAGVRSPADYLVTRPTYATATRTSSSGAGRFAACLRYYQYRNVRERRIRPSPRSAHRCGGRRGGPRAACPRGLRRDDHRARGRERRRRARRRVPAMALEGRDGLRRRRPLRRPSRSRRQRDAGGRPRRARGAHRGPHRNRPSARLSRASSPTWLATQSSPGRSRIGCLPPSGAIWR
jgi:hypothetical protein